MTEPQRLFLVQARTDFEVFKLLCKQSGLPECHALHYLQMATELLAKAHAWRNGPPPESHRALVPFLQGLSHNRKAQKQLGFERLNENWRSLIKKSLSFADRIQQLAPALADNGPNPEYPWPRAVPRTAPAEHRFEIWQELQTGPGRQFIKLIGNLFKDADTFL